MIDIERLEHRENENINKFAYDSKAILATEYNVRNNKTILSGPDMKPSVEWSIKIAGRVNAITKLKIDSFENIFISINESLFSIGTKPKIIKVDKRGLIVNQKEIKYSDSELVISKSGGAYFSAKNSEGSFSVFEINKKVREIYKTIYTTTYELIFTQKGNLIMLLDHGRYLTCVDSSLNEKWLVKLKRKAIGPISTYMEEGIIYCDNECMNLYDLRGNIVWQYAGRVLKGHRLPYLVVVDNIIYGSFSTLKRGRYLAAINSEGNEIWSYEHNGTISGSPICFLDGEILFCTNEHQLILLNSKQEKKWECGLGDYAKKIIFDSFGNIYIILGIRGKNTLIAFDRAGNKKWEYLPNAIIYDIVLGNNKSLYMTISVVSKDSKNKNIVSTLLQKMS